MFLLFAVPTYNGRSIYCPCHRDDYGLLASAYDFRCRVVAASDDKEAIAAAYRLLKEE